MIEEKPREKHSHSHSRRTRKPAVEIKLPAAMHGMGGGRRGGAFGHTLPLPLPLPRADVGEMRDVPRQAEMLESLRHAARAKRVNTEALQRRYGAREGETDGDGQINTRMHTVDAVVCEQYLAMWPVPFAQTMCHLNW